jgi:hypothetical protein
MYRLTPWAASPRYRVAEVLCEMKYTDSSPDLACTRWAVTRRGTLHVCFFTTDFSYSEIETSCIFRTKFIFINTILAPKVAHRVYIKWLP